MFTEGLGDHYIFHGVERFAGGGGYKLGYAGKFAAFITENKLGFIAAGKPQGNKRYHADHICQVFIWNPDHDAVYAWWNAHRPATPKPAAVVVLAEAELWYSQNAEAEKDK